LFSSSKDVQNVIEFLYTGKISLNSRSDFDMFQQLIFEWQIGYNDYPIILEEDEEFQNRIRVSPMLKKKVSKRTNYL